MKIMNSPKGVLSCVPKRASISCPTCDTHHDALKIHGNQSCASTHGTQNHIKHQRRVKSYPLTSLNICTADFAKSVPKACPTFPLGLTTNTDIVWRFTASVNTIWTTSKFLTIHKLFVDVRRPTRWNVTSHRPVFPQSRGEWRAFIALYTQSHISVTAIQMDVWFREILVMPNINIWWTHQRQLRTLPFEFPQKKVII